MDQIDAAKTHNPFAVNDIALARDTGRAVVMRVTDAVRSGCSA